MVPFVRDPSVCNQRVAPQPVSHHNSLMNNLLRVKKAFASRFFKKGSRSIKMTLENEFGIVYNLKRIRRLMKKFNVSLTMGTVHSAHERSSFP